MRACGMNSFGLGKLPLPVDLIHFPNDSIFVSLAMHVHTTDG